MNDRRDFIKSLLASAVAIPIGAEAFADIPVENEKTPLHEQYKSNLHEHIKQLCEEIKPNINVINNNIKEQSLIHAILLPSNTGDNIQIAVNPQVRLSELIARKQFFKEILERKCSARIRKMESRKLFDALDEHSFKTNTHWKEAIIYVSLVASQMPHALVVNKEMLLEMNENGNNPLFKTISKKQIFSDDGVSFKNGYIGRYYTGVDEIDEIDGLKVYADFFTHQHFNGEPRAYLLPEPKLAGTYKDTKYECIILPNDRELRTGHIVYNEHFGITLNPNADFFRIA